MLRIVTLLSILISYNSTGAEIDQFTLRHIEIKDSKDIINQKFNEYMQEALVMVNHFSDQEISVSEFRNLQTKSKDYRAQQKLGDCNAENAQDTLYKKLRLFFNSHRYDSVFFNYYFHNDEVEKKSVNKKNSIYQDWKKTDGFLIASKKAEESGVGVAPVLNFNGVEIGTDKFEHFLGSGFRNFSKKYIRGKSFLKVMKEDHLRERTILGGTIFATGIYSFADLVANFNGMRFWNHILQTADDIKGKEHNIGPYLQCDPKTGQWKQVKEIDLSHYVDSAWDEAINCSMTASKAGAEKIRKALKALSQKHQKDYSCPLDPRKLNQMVQKYGEFGPYLLNLHGTQQKAFKAHFNNYGVYKIQKQKKNPFSWGK
jgi:hypothetical protein